MITVMDRRGRAVFQSRPIPEDFVEGNPSPKISIDLLNQLGREKKVGFIALRRKDGSGTVVIALDPPALRSLVAQSPSLGSPLWRDTVAAVRSAGGTVLDDPDDVGANGRMVRFRDPGGAELAGWQPYNFAGSAFRAGPGVPVASSAAFGFGSSWSCTGFGSTFGSAAR